MADLVEQAAERLYGLPLEDFTRERDSAAKALRRDKERDAAATVAKLPKPAAGAWAVNVLAREQPELRDELLAAGEALREAQAAALAGRGAQELRDATARERQAVDAVLEAAGRLRPAGRPLSATAVDRLRQTLHAAAADEDVRGAIAAGRLVRDAPGGGAWPFGTDDELAPEPAPKAPPQTRSRVKDPAAAERDEEGRAAAERRREIEARLATARAERRGRERELGRAEREAERADKRLERARAEAAEARRQADEAHAELEAARAAVREARDEVGRLEEQMD